jgi:hypothetical protein
MTIKENESKVGYGSWYLTQRYGDYKPMAFEDYRQYIYKTCVERVRDLNLIDGDLIRITYVGGFKPRKFKAHFHLFNGRIALKQKSRVISFPCELIDDIEVLSKNKNVVFLDEFEKKSRYLH